LTTIETSLQQFLALSSMLQTITQKTRTVTVTMEQMQEAAEKGAQADRKRLAKKIEIVESETNISQALFQAIALQKMFNKTVEQGGSAADKLKGKLQNATIAAANNNPDCKPACRPPCKPDNNAPNRAASNAANHAASNAANRAASNVPANPAAGQAGNVIAAAAAVTSGNNAAGKSGGAADKLLGQMQNAASSAFDLAKKAWDMSISGAMKQQQMIDALSARAGSGEVGGAIFDQISEQALKFGQNVDQALSGAMSFMSHTADPQQLSELSKLSMRLAKLNPSQGLTGAADSMNALMSGDASAIAKNFSMNAAQVQHSDAFKAAKAGDMDGFIKGLDELLNQRNMTEEAFESMLDNPAAQWQRVTETFKFRMAQAGQGALAALEPLTSFLIESFESGRFDPFFKMLSAGFTIVSSVLYGVAQAALYFFELAVQYWPIIATILLTIAGILVAQVMTSIISTAAAFLMMYWPVLLIVAGIMLLVMGAMQLGVTFDQVIGFVVGLFYSLFAYVMNIVASLWNIILAFAEFLRNIFIDPVYAIQKLVYDLKMNFFEALYAMTRSVEDFAGDFMKVILNSINGALGFFNKLVEAVNDIFGTNYEPVSLLDENNVNAISDKIKEHIEQMEEPTSSKHTVDLSHMKMGFQNISDAFNTGFDTGKGIVDKANKAMSGSGFSSFKDKLAGAGAGFPNGMGSHPGMGIAARSAPGGGVSPMNDSVEAYEEDVKLMRDLAEMKAVQNYVTLTPTVQVTTGPISNEVDVNELIRKIESVMNQEIDANVQGIYGV